MSTTAHHVVIVGGGFGGLRLALQLRGATVSVTLIDRRNFHLFQALLYQVATGALSPANIATPLRALFKRQRNVEVVLGEVVEIDAKEKKVRLAPPPGVPALAAHQSEIAYDTLILASGSRHHYFGHDEWEQLAPGLKTVEDATEIRRRILGAFEAAERESDLERRKALLTFVIVGAGPTGVELAGAVAEISRHTLRGEFRQINPADARILLIEATDRVLPPFPPELSAKAAQQLERLGVTVRTRCQVTALEPEKVTLRCGENVEIVGAHTVLWAAGVIASPLGKKLSTATGCELDKNGRVIVAPDLSISGHPEIFVIGDLAHSKGADGKPLPGLAPVAIQQGQYVADLIAARLRKKTMAPFRYRDPGTLATIGRSAAVADLHWIRFSGWLAWFVWVFVHLLKIVQFQNRLLVLVQWAWNYFTRNRAARLITGEQQKPPI